MRERRKEGRNCGWRKGGREEVDVGEKKGRKEGKKVSERREKKKKERKEGSKSCFDIM